MVRCITHVSEPYFRKYCNKYNTKTANALHFWVDLEGVFRGQLGELEIDVQTYELNADNVSALRELWSVSTPNVAGASPTKQMPEALIE